MITLKDSYCDICISWLSINFDFHLSHISQSFIIRIISHLVWNIEM